MPKRKLAGDASLDNGPAFPDDAPELTAEFFERGEITEGGKVVRRGRPPIAGGKESVTLRIDRAVLDVYRAGGPGWQTRINDVLRRNARKLQQPASPRRRGKV